MGKKIPRTTLSELMPTEEELKVAKDEAAKLALETPAAQKAKRAKMGAMSAYLKTIDDSVATLSRGALREQYMVNYIVLQNRSRLTTKEMANDHRVSKETAKHTNVFEWGDHPPKDIQIQSDSHPTYQLMIDFKWEPTIFNIYIYIYIYICISVYIYIYIYIYI